MPIIEMTLVERRNYVNVHYWLVKKHGKADKCMHCTDTGKSKFEWALKKGFTYEKNINNFIPLCKSCHGIYDKTPESIEKQRSKMIGRKASEETRAKTSLARLSLQEFPKGWVLPQEVRDKMSKSKKGVPIGVGKILSEAHRKSISDGLKKYRASQRENKIH